MRLEVLRVELLGKLLAVGLLHSHADGDGVVVHALRVEGRLSQRRHELGAISAGEAARTGGLALGGLNGIGEMLDSGASRYALQLLLG